MTDRFAEQQCPECAGGAGYNHAAGCTLAGFAPPTFLNAAEPHDQRLEPLDETWAEVQSGVVQSRQLRAAIPLEELRGKLWHCASGYETTGDPRFLLALIVYAVRLHEGGQ